ncbi:MAG: hypothetical protein MJZ22_05910 [Candidatus Saccharibacteria bacterium]|nr:hypothetical protein [Candidatus Saccharibacteria bacterium]
MCKELINKRFISVINSLLDDKKEVSKAVICQKFRISPQKFSEILKERMNVGTDLIASIAQLYPEYSLRWLLLGEGSMLKTAEKGVETASESGSNGTIEALKGIIKEQATEIATLRLMIQQMQAPPVGVQEAFTA